MSASTPSGIQPRPAEIAALLRWYVEAGVDAILEEAPRDRFAETAREAAERHRRSGPPGLTAAAGGAGRLSEASPVAPPVIGHSPAPSAVPPGAHPEADRPFPAFFAPQPESQAAEDARERARSAATLAELEATLAEFTGCNLRVTAKSLVFGDGDPNAELMLVGEAPGREEDIAGAPFVGRSGQLLNRMLAAIGLERAQVRVTNTVPWRPPGNRSPTPAETEICLPFVLRQIELVRPKVLVCLGSPSAKALLRTDEGILRLRGRWTEFRLGDAEETIPATALLHPAYLLRQPGQKRLAWRDLLAIKARLAD